MLYLYRKEGDYMIKDNKEIYMKKIGNRIKYIRENQNMTQEELAKKCGYSSRSTINKIELGINDVPYSKINNIAQALNVNPVDVFNWESNETICEEIKLCEQIQKAYGKDAFELLSTYLTLNNDGKQAAITMLQGLSTNDNFKS